MTCTEIFTQMAGRYQEMGISGVNGVFQFNIRGTGGGQWFVVCQDRSCQVRNGAFDRPDVTVEASADTVIKLVEKRMNPTLALLTRKVKLKGNLRLASQIQEMLAGRI